VVSSDPLPVSLPDPDGEPFLEIAISGRADYLATGNASHFPSQSCQGVKVLSPANFLKGGIKRHKSIISRTYPGALNRLNCGSG